MAESAPRVRRCPRCKNPVESESQGCPSCGYLSPIARQQSAAIVPISVETPRTRKTPITVHVLRAIGIVNLLIGTLFAVVLIVETVIPDKPSASGASYQDPRGGITSGMLTFSASVTTAMLLFAAAHIVETLVNIENKLSSRD